MTDVAMRIEYLRLKKGLTRAALCKLAGIPATTMSNYIIRGDKVPPDTVEAMAKVLGVTALYLNSGKTVSMNLQAEMDALRDRIAAMPKKKQAQTVKAIYRTICAIEEGKGC